MQYSKIRSRAGLVALVFALIISLVSAVPIPATESGLSSTLSPPSNPSLNGKDHIQLDTARIPEISLSGRMSTLPAATRALTRRHIPTSMDNQLVRRNVFSKIKHAFQKAGSAIKSGFQKAGNAIKHVAQKVGSGIKNVAQKVGSGIKHVAQKVGSGIKNVAKKVGNGIKIAAKKVGNFVKTTGAKVAKFGLKVVQSVGEAVGTVASFIPEVGKPIQQAIHGVSKVAGVISDHIHTKLSGKLQKGMDIMNKADQIMSYIPRRREFSEEEAFQQRDISETNYFEERDDIALENREESYFEGYERDIYEPYGLDQE
jgi:gas vesicle protein